MLARAGIVLYVVHSSAMKMKLQTTTSPATTPPLLLDVHWPHKIWRTDHQQLQALEITEAKRACQHQVEEARMQRLRMASDGMLLRSLMCRMACSVCPTRRHVVENGSGAGRMKGKWRRVILS